MKAATKRLDQGDTRGSWTENNRWMFNRERTVKFDRAELSAVDEKWSLDHPELIAWAMTLAGEVLFVAGPPDLLDEEAAVRRRSEPTVQRQIQQQDEALLGQHGGILWAVSTTDGKRQSEMKLDAMPVWDGTAAAQGRLYLATVDGKLICMGGRGNDE